MNQIDYRKLRIPNERMANQNEAYSRQDKALNNRHQ